MDVYGQPICILKMEHTLLKWAVDNICYTWFCGFNSQVRVNVLSHNLICSSFGMLGSYINFIPWFSLWFGCIICLMIVSCALGNFMWWELRFSWVWELGYEWGISIYIRKSFSVVSFGFHLGEENENMDTWAPLVQSLASSVFK